MKKYTIKELTEKINELLNMSEDETQEMLEYELTHIDEELLCEMADLVPEETGVPCLIWADGPRNMKHGFRIKFQNSYCNRDDGSEMIPITISKDNPQIPKSVKTRLKIKNKDFKKLQRWIILNYDALIGYAQGRLHTREFLDKIQPLRD